MENRFLDNLTRPLSVELPPAESMDQYIDQMLPKIRQYGEDLREEEFFLDKPWLEFRDDVNFHHSILHFFKEGGEYLRCVDGDCKNGSWRYLDGVNKMLIDLGKTSQLYDLAFLDNQFFILDKHGDQTRLGQPKYFVMIHEQIGRKIEWRDGMELLFNKYRNSNAFFVTVAVVVVVLILFFLAFY